MTDIINSIADAVEEPESKVAPVVDEGVAVPEISASELDGNGFIKKSRRKVSLDTKKARAGYLFVLPFLIGFVLIYLPILVDSLWLSFTNKPDLSTLPPDADPTKQYFVFDGLANYRHAFSTSDFTVALKDGLMQIVFQVPAIIVFSLFIAVVLNQKMLGRAVFRAIFFLPVIVSTGIIESINASDDFRNMTSGGINDGSGGSSNDIVSVLDFQALFADMKVGGELVVYVVNIVNQIYDIINYSGVQMLIFLAGLQSISPSIYEACRIDGATGWETFWKVTFPMISPIILVNAFYTVIDVLTKSQNPMVDHISNKVQSYHVASAMYWIYFIIIILIVAAVAGICSSFVFYQRKE